MAVCSYGEDRQTERNESEKGETLSEKIDCNLIGQGHKIQVLRLLNTIKCIWGTK